MPGQEWPLSYSFKNSQNGLAMARNLTGEIIDPERFAWALGKAHSRYGWTMHLSKLPILIKNRAKKRTRVASYSLVHTAENLAIYCPFVVVWTCWCRKGTEPIKQAPQAFRAMGLDEEYYLEIRDAASEAPEHDRDLRKLLLDSCGLKDKPHKSRQLRNYYGEYE